MLALPQEVGPRVRLARAEGARCERCWRHKDHLGVISHHPTLGGRCVAVLEGAAAKRLNPARDPPRGGVGLTRRDGGARFAAGSSATHGLGRSGLNAGPQPAAHAIARNGAEYRKRTRDAAGSWRLELGRGIGRDL